MKSFGIRLTAGLVTILFGAYAAALAQKDKQDNSTSWIAEAPNMGKPAVPISANDGQTLPSEPEPTTASSLADIAASTFGSQKSGSNESQSNPIALVQHTEDVSSPGFALPSSLGTPEVSDESQTPLGTSAEMEIPSWTMPPTSAPASTPQADLQDTITTESALSNTFASETPQSTFAQPGNRTNGQTEPLQTISLAQVPNVQVFAEPPEAPETSPSPFAQKPSQSPFAAQNGATPESTGTADGATENFAPAAFGGNSLRDPVATETPAPYRPGDNSFAPNQSETTPLAQNTQTFSTPTPQQDPRFGAAPNQLDTEFDRGHTIQAGNTFAIPGQNNAAQQRPERTASLPNRFDVPTNTVGPTAPSNPSFQTQQNFGSGSNPQAQPNFTPGQSVGSRLRPGTPSQLMAINPDTVTGSPGDRRLEGVQTPSIVIHKRAPAEVKVGKPASFVVNVQNVGSVEALGVVVHDRVPAGMRLVDASPQPIMQGDLLMWQLGAMAAGEERTVTMQLVPETEGELGSVARVTFEAAASVRTISTRPELKVTQRARDKVLIGQQLEIELEVSNPGSGDATGVSLKEDVPEGLEHPRGKKLDNLLGTLASGEVRNQVLRLRAVRAGMIQNTIRLVSEDGLSAEHTINIEVVAPKLEVELKGPSRRFLERQATYQLGIFNTGTATATNVEIVVGLDRGFTFVSTDYEGQYDPSRHAVTWSLESLPAGTPATVPLTLLPVQEGERALTIDARADLSTVARAERSVSVEGFAELNFQIVNPGGPIEMGAESSYEISVVNSGSKPDSNVQVAVQLPPGLQLIGAEGDSGPGAPNGPGRVDFPPMAELATGQTIKYRLRVRGVAPGTHLVKAVVMSAGATVPVAKEESTLVYADQ